MALLIKERLFNYAFPLWMIAIGVYGVLRVFLELLLFQGLADVLHPEKLSRRAFGKSWLILNSWIKEKEELGPLPNLDKKAYGVVVEVGPGSGNQLSRYDKSKVTKIYGIEPNKDFHETLRATIKKEGLEGIYEIVPCGVEDFDSLEEYGVLRGNVDTVMSISVLCSIPRPQDMVKAMYKLLKPGGQMLVHEHVASTDTITGFVQDVYEIVWPHMFGGCELRRPSGQYLAAAGKWEKLEFEPPTPEDEVSITPRVIGRLVKSTAVK